MQLEPDQLAKRKSPQKAHDLFQRVYLAGLALAAYIID